MDTITFIEIKEFNLEKISRDKGTLQIMEQLKMDTEGQITVTGTSEDWVHFIGTFLNNR